MHKSRTAQIFMYRGDILSVNLCKCKRLCSENYIFTALFYVKQCVFAIGRSWQRLFVCVNIFSVAVLEN